LSQELIILINTRIVPPHHPSLFHQTQTSNITWGSHGPFMPAFKYPCFDNMKDIEPGSGVGNSPFAMPSMMAASI